MLEAFFTEGNKKVQTKEVWQYDRGVQLCVKGLEGLDADTEFHFETEKGKTAVVKKGVFSSRDNSVMVSVPAAFLEHTESVMKKIWVYQTDGEAGFTEAVIIVPLLGRARPDDYISPDDWSDKDAVERAIEDYLDEHPLDENYEKSDYKKTEITNQSQTGDNDTYYPTVGAVRNFVNFVKGELEDRIDDECDDIDSAKADKSTTLAGYGITNAYTKSEVDSLVDNEAVPAYVTTEVNRLAAVVNARRSANTLTMLFIGDMHADPEHIQLTAEQTATLSAALKHAGQAVNALAELVPFDLMAVLGDYVYGTQQTTASGLKCFDEINGYIKKGFSKAQNIRIAGNHDDLRYNHTTDYLNGGQLYSLVGKYSTMPVYGSREKNYGYIDFDSHKVRVIFVNANDGTTNGPENGNVSEEQLQWFADTLGETGQKTGWHILILSHQPIDFRTVSPLGNIVSDYIDGASNTYYNFTNKNSAKLIGNIHGHIHNCLVDNLYKISNGSATAMTAYRMAIPNACFYLNGNGNGYDPTLNYGINYSDNDYATAAYQTKISGGANDTAFTVVTIDLANEMAYADQYGYGHYKNCDRSFSFGSVTPPTPSVTNQLPLSQYPLQTVSGVMNAKRWSGSGIFKDKESETPYSKATGYIPVSTGDIIRMSGIKFGANTVQKNSTCYIHSYGSSLTPENSGAYNSANQICASQLSSQPSFLSFASNIQYDSNGNIIQFTVTSGSYITVCSNSTTEDGGIPDNAVLTINEMIQ